jgi:hypothetical protein
MPSGVYTRTEEHSTKLRAENLGRTPWNKGKECPNISAGLKGQTPWNKGKKCPQLSVALKGKTGGWYKGKKHPQLAAKLKGRKYPEMSGERHFRYTHGLSRHYLESTHREMIQRCNNPKAVSYKDYGAKGITVWEPWQEKASFIFGIISILGDRPVGYSIDRINPHGNYEPGNVRWADARTQTLNQRLRVTDYHSQCGEH